MAFMPKYLLSIEEMTEYYDKFRVEITVLQCILHIYEKDCHIPILTNNVIDVNRCFIKNINLLEEIIISKAIIRNQLQNLVYLYAESKHKIILSCELFTIREILHSDRAFHLWKLDETLGRYVIMMSK